MLDLTTRGMHALGMMIRGADDQVFAGTGLVRITLRILVSVFYGFQWREITSTLRTVAWV